MASLAEENANRWARVKAKGGCCRSLTIAVIKGREDLGEAPEEGC